MATVRWTTIARREFRGIVESATAYSPGFGRTLASRITDALDDLEPFPRIGRMVPDFQDDALRELIVDDYRVVYRLVGAEAWILTVIHGSRDLLRHLPDGPWDIE